MNHIFFSVWCEQSQTFVAVPETTSSAGKQTSGARAKLAAQPVFRLRHLALALALTTGTLALALPTGGVVTAGSATVGTSGNVTTIVQGTPNVVINWQSFGLAPAEQIRFVQPGTSAIALNRVLGADPSRLLGTLTANGKVFLVNPNGILFGQGAQVNVGGLVASTLQLADGDFLAGRFRFSGDSTASVVNQGSIRAPGGQVALLGATVRNSGDIVANLGSVALAAGKKITLDLVGDGLLQVAVNEAALNALVQNGGLIQADGGQILLTTNAGSELLQGAVNQTGVLQAQSVGNRNGRIYLLGGAETAVVAGGTLDASGLAAGQTGGTVHVLGGTVSLKGAQVQASGDASGGTVLLGGDYQGAGALRRAQSTSLDNATSVQADATTAGQGGQIVVWSDGRTDVAGVLSARGGSQAGNGGLIETSGQKVLVATGTSVNTLAPAGQTGVWLLDPPNYTIAGAAGDETPAQVTTSLATTNRLIVATNDIVVADALTWSTAQTLTLRAGNNVNVNAAVTASTASSGIVLDGGNDVSVSAAMTASGAGSAIRMTALRDVTTSGAITASASGALIDMSAGRNTSVGVVTADGGGSISLKANNNVTVNGAVGADGGPVSLRADNDGTGPGVAGGTVVFAGAGAVSAPNTTIRFNPAGYANTGAEIAAYVTKVTGALDARAWVFGRGVDKVYDGNVTDTLAFKGTPTLGGDVTLVPGTASFDTKDVGTGKTVTFSGYTLGGVDVARFDLFAAGGLTTADITPAPLTVTASNVVKAYGDTPTLSGFTHAGLVNAETIGSVTETSPGQVATASVAGSPYAITPSAATGGTFTPSNYTITYVNGVLSVTPAPLTVTASNVAKVYGDTPTLSGFTHTGLINAETIGSVTETSPGQIATASVAGSPYAITPSAATGGTFTPSNYTITYTNGVLSVTPAPLTVTASNVVKVFGDTPTLSGFTSTGLVNAESIGSVTGTSPGQIAAASVAGSPYAITPSAATGGTFTPSNYTISYVDGALSVTPVVVPPVVVPPVVVPPVVPPVVVPPVVAPPVVAPPVVVPPEFPPVTTPEVTTPEVTPEAPPVVPPGVPPVLFPDDNIDPKAPVTVLPPARPPELQTLVIPPVAVQRVPVRPSVPVLAPKVETPTPVAQPELIRLPVKPDTPVERIPKQDRN